MRAVVDIACAEDRCGDCKLAVWQDSANGWSWTCPLFSQRLTENSYWRSDPGWKKVRMRDPATLRRCRLCVEATEKA